MDQADLFGGGAMGLKDKRSFDGNDVRSIPAFIFGEELADMAETDPRVVVMTADLARSNRTNDFASRHPERFFNFGIAEKNMITAAAGIAANGFVSYVATFAAFAALLGAEQIRTDCAYPGMPVRILGTNSGMSMGFYGTSHHSLEDIGMMRSIADLTVVCASDANQLRAILRASADHPGAMYLRLGRGRDPEVYSSIPEITFGKAITLREGTDLTLIATGTEVHPSLRAAEILEKEGVSTTVIDMHTLSSLDIDAIVSAAGRGPIMTVEEHNITNGLGTAVAEVLLEAGMAGVRFKRHGVPNEFVPVGPPAALYAHYRLDAEGIAAVTRELLGG
jgi:transketolase